MTTEKLVAGPLRGVAERLERWLKLSESLPCTSQVWDLTKNPAVLSSLHPDCACMGCIFRREIAEALASLPSSPQHYIVFATADDQQAASTILAQAGQRAEGAEAALGSGQELRERIERVISAGDDLRYDEYGVMEMPIGHLATKWDIAKAELEAALALPLAPKVPDERET